MIEVNNLSKHYRKSTAVKDISFSVDSGKVTGFLGPNGAGKSTTMRLMLGLDKGGGTTKYDGRPLKEYPVPSKIVGILLEAKSFHPTRTARNHLRVLATAGSVPLARVDEVLDIVGLSQVAKKEPGKFSLGMSQRLGVAAAILAKPKYLILDEPANGLDPEGIVWLREFLKSYTEDGNAVFVSSHLLSEMSQMAENVIVIGKGELIASTSIQDLISKNTKSSVFVRATNLNKLKTILAGKSFNSIQKNGGLEITGAKTDDVGRLAHSGDIEILELTSQNASLEDVFLDLTENKEEFQAQSPKKKVAR